MKESMEGTSEAGYGEFVERPGRPFANLSPEALRDFELLKTTSRRLAGEILFEQGQAAQQVFVCEGMARLSVSSESGERLVLRVAEPGELLGLSACLSDRPYEMTVELLGESCVEVIQRRDLLRFLHEHCGACLQIVNLLSQDLHLAYSQVRALGMGRSRRPRAERVH